MTDTAKIAYYKRDRHCLNNALYAWQKNIRNICNINNHSWDGGKNIRDLDGEGGLEHSRSWRWGDKNIRDLEDEGDKNIRDLEGEGVRTFEILMVRGIRTFEILMMKGIRTFEILKMRGVRTFEILKVKRKRYRVCIYRIYEKVASIKVHVFLLITICCLSSMVVDW